LATLGVVCALTAALFAPVENPLVSPQLGAELRASGGAPLVLDEPAPLIAPR